MVLEVFMSVWNDFTGYNLCDLYSIIVIKRLEFCRRYFLVKENMINYKSLYFKLVYAKILLTPAKSCKSMNASFANLSGICESIFCNLQFNLHKEKYLQQK